MPEALQEGGFRSPGLVVPDMRGRLGAENKAVLGKGVPLPVVVFVAV